MSDILIIIAVALAGVLWLVIRGAAQRFDQRLADVSYALGGERPDAPEGRK